MISRFYSSPKLAAKVFATALGLGFLFPVIINHFRLPSLPTLDENCLAYVLLLEGCDNGKYADAKPKFDQAYSMSQDPEIRYLADYFSRNCALALKAGIESHEEGNSLEGGIKGGVLGFFSPLDSLTAWDLELKKWFGDFDRNCDLVDARYRPQIRNYLAIENARKNVSHFSWLIFLTVIVSFYWDAVSFRTGRRSETAKS
jgi:hypothetical protein